MSKVSSAAEVAMRAVDEHATPSKMTQAEALEFYESIVSDCEARIDGLKADIGPEVR